MQEFQYDTFISYSHKDVAWVEQVLLPHFQKERIHYHYDADFEAGVPSIMNMENGVENSRKVILVLTPNWVQSDWSTFEGVLVQTADPIGRLRRIIPVMIQRCELPPRIRMLTYIDLTQAHPGTADFEVEMQRLIATIRKQPPLGQPPKNTLPPQLGKMGISLPPLPIERPDWVGGLKLAFEDDIYLLAPTKEEPIEKYEAEDKGSIIWQARAMQLNKQSRLVWLKQVVKQRDSRSSQSNLQALRAEYSLLDRLSLVPYPQCIDFYEQDDALTLAYKYPPGKTLAQHYRLSDQPLDLYYVKPFLRNLLPLFDTLGVLHDENRKDRAHRMLSPTSIIILPQRPGAAVLRDLGLAAFPARIKEGPGGYQTPEQIDWGGEGKLNMPGPKTDIYQLAAIIYRILTGLPVHSPWNILPPSAVNKHLPAALDTVLLRALAPEKDKRWPHMKNFSGELKRVMNQM